MIARVDEIVRVMLAYLFHAITRRHRITDEAALVARPVQTRIEFKVVLL